MNDYYFLYFMCFVEFLNYLKCVSQTMTFMNIKRFAFQRNENFIINRI